MDKLVDNKQIISTYKSVDREGWHIHAMKQYNFHFAESLWTFKNGRQNIHFKKKCDSIYHPHIYWYIS